MKLLHVVGARPNFMKLAPVLLAGHSAGDVEQVVVHTGQHYDREMSDRFTLPTKTTDVGSGSQREQAKRTCYREVS